MSAQPNEELKPCPMKSSHPYGATEVRELMPDYWMVQCLTAQHHVSVSGYKTKELAIEAWNRRAQSPPVAQVEVYRRALGELVEVLNYSTRFPHGKPGTWVEMSPILDQKVKQAEESLLTSKPEPEEECRCQRKDAPPLDHWSGCPVWKKFWESQPKPVCPKCHGKKTNISHIQVDDSEPYLCPFCQGTGQAPVAPVRKWEAEDEK